MDELKFENDVVLVLEVCNPDRFDKEAYRRELAEKIADAYGPDVDFDMDDKPRRNDQFLFWFITVKLKWRSAEDWEKFLAERAKKPD